MSVVRKTHISIFLISIFSFQIFLFICPLSARILGSLRGTRACSCVFKSLFLSHYLYLYPMLLLQHTVFLPTPHLNLTIHSTQPHSASAPHSPHSSPPDTPPHPTRTFCLTPTPHRLGVQTFRRESDRFWILAAHREQNLLAAGVWGELRAEQGVV
jgi:hypothetical protein